MNKDNANCETLMYICDYVCVREREREHYILIKINTDQKPGKWQKKICIRKQNGLEKKFLLNIKWKTGKYKTKNDEIKRYIVFKEITGYFGKWKEKNWQLIRIISKHRTCQRGTTVELVGIHNSLIFRVHTFGSVECLYGVECHVLQLVGNW